MMGIVGTYFANGFIKVCFQTFKNSETSAPLSYNLYF